MKEDIYPLTIVKIRYGGKIVIFNADNDAGFIQFKIMKKFITYTIWEAFEDYKKRLYKY